MCRFGLLLCGCFFMSGACNQSRIWLISVVASFANIPCFPPLGYHLKRHNNQTIKQPSRMRHTSAVVRNELGLPFARKEIKYTVSYLAQYRTASVLSLWLLILNWPAASNVSDLKKTLCLCKCKTCTGLPVVTRLENTVFIVTQKMTFFVIIFCVLFQSQKFWVRTKL